jgi:hypothetical protein
MVASNNRNLFSNNFGDKSKVKVQQANSLGGHPRLLSSVQLFLGLLGL